jgi:hypothetical protein
VGGIEPAEQKRHTLTSMLGERTKVVVAADDPAEIVWSHVAVVEAWR